MLKLYTFACLASFSSAIAQCGGTLNGVEYDFTPLQKAEGNYDIPAIPGKKLQFNLCKTLDTTLVERLHCKKQETGIVALLNIAENDCSVLSFGVAGSPVLSELDKDGEKGVVLTFTNPGTTKEDMCESDIQKHSQMLVNVICDPAAGTPDKWVATNGRQTYPNDSCSWSADIRSVLGCSEGTVAPTAPTSPTSSSTTTPTSPTSSPTTSAPTRTLVPNTYFDLEMDSTLVVDHGKPSKGFTADEKTEATVFHPYIIAGSEKKSMKISVGNIGIFPDTASVGAQFEPQTIEGVVMTTSKDLELIVDYMCPDDTKKNEEYSIKMTLVFPGEGFDNVTAEWKKTCGPVPSPWSTAQLFFFVVFILILVGCVIGCGYNYVKMGKSGCDLIPCIGLLSRCRGDGAASHQGYAAHNDYTAGEAATRDGDIGGNNAYGSTYHSEI